MLPHQQVTLIALHKVRRQGSDAAGNTYRQHTRASTNSSTFGRFCALPLLSHEPAQHAALPPATAGCCPCPLSATQYSFLQPLTGAQPANTGWTADLEHMQAEPVVTLLIFDMQGASPCTCIILMHQVPLLCEEVQSACLVPQHKVQRPSYKLCPVCHDMAACHTAVSCYCTQKREVLGPQLWLPGNQPLSVCGAREEACSKEGGTAGRCMKAAPC